MHNTEKTNWVTQITKNPNKFQNILNNKYRNPLLNFNITIPKINF